MDILMAILDLVPVVLFLIGSIIFQRDLYNKMSKGAFAIFSTGTILVFFAGLLKAIYKILGYGFGINWVTLNAAFFPMQTCGFVFAAAGMVAMLFFHQGEGKAYSFVGPALMVTILANFTENEEFNGTMILVVLMMLGVLTMDGCGVYVASKMKAYHAIPFFVLNFIGVCGMGYLSTKPELSDWIKEGVNTVAQGAFLVSAILLRKAGLGRPDALENIQPAKHK